MSDMRHTAEDALHELYTRMLDYISTLEDRCRVYERQLREYRGQSGNEVGQL